MAEVERRRRRLRRPSSNQPAVPAPPPSRPVPGPSAQTSAVHDPDLEQVTSNGNGNGDDRETERGLRGLVGSGASQVSLSAAMRARDAARPDDADLAAAERDLMIVRRGWVPREDLPRTLR
jgi:hypothetical protein